MKKINQFKARCSAIGTIMSGRIGLTEIQEKKLEELKFKIKLTNNQNDELTKLIIKQQNPELPEGVKTYCKDWLKGQLFNRHSRTDNVYVQKGLINEDEAIDFAAKKLGYGFLLKNLESFENDFIMGSPDVLPGNTDTVIEIKNSWSWETFPYMEEEIQTANYYYQIQGYLWLTNRKNGLLVYCLTNTPDHLIERTARSFCINNGYEQMDIDVYNSFHDELNYSDLPDDLKIKTFIVERDDKVISEISVRVAMCRKYIEELKKSLNI